MTHSRSSNMETAVFLGLLGLGYVTSKSFGKKSEGFQNLEGTPDLRIGPNTSYSPGVGDGERSPSTYAATRAQVYTPANARTVPGKPRQPNTLGAGKYDEQFLLPAGGSLPAEPNPSQLQAIPNGYFPVPPNVSTDTGRPDCRRCASGTPRRLGGCDSTQRIRIRFEWSRVRTR